MRRAKTNGVGVATARGDVAALLTTRVAWQMDGQCLPASPTLIVSLRRLRVGADRLRFGPDTLLVGACELLSADQGICPGTVFIGPTCRLGAATRPRKPLIGLSPAFCRRRRDVEITRPSQRPPLSAAAIGRISLPLKGR